MKNKLLLAINILFLLGFTSCEKEDSMDVNQDKIYTDYEIFYNKNEDKTHVRANFRFGGPTGTNLELTDSTSAYVTFNGDTLPFNGFYLSHHKEYAGRILSGTFEYRNTDGQTYTNTISPGDSIAFPSSFDTITKGNAQTLNWNGTSLGANESVAIFVGSWTWGDDAFFFTNDNGASNIVMGVNQKAELPIGPSTLYMDRSHEEDLDEGTAEGGKMRYKYRCLNRSVQVVN